MTRRLVIGLLPLVAIALCAQGDTAQEANPRAERQVTESSLIETVEIESGRSATTRIWENIYQEPVLDIDGNPTGEVEERREQYTELATGLCYNSAADGEPADWQPTVTDFVRTGDNAYPFEVTTGPLQVRLSNDPTWGSHVQVTANGEAITLGVAGLVVQDPETGATTLLEEARRVEPIVEGNRILFPGAFSCGDLEYVYHRHGFEQNLIITSRQGLPSEGLIGLASTLDTSATAPRLTAQSDVAAALRHSSQLAAAAGQPPQGRQSQSDGGSAVNLSARLSGGEVVQAEETPLAFVNADNLPVMHFAQGQAWDAAGRSGGNTVAVRQSALQCENRPILVDAVDAAWLGDAELPVTVDYIIQMSGGQGPKNILFERGITYFISGTYIIGNGETLIVEPGAVIKINGSALGIRIDSGGTLRMAAREFDPIVVTCADDSGVGSSITGATAGDYSVALWFRSGSLGSVQWAKFGNGSLGIYLGGDLSSFDSIAHCVFRDLSSAMASEGFGSLTIFNCLFANAEPTGTVNSGTAIECWSDSIELTVTNCTFHGFTKSVCLENFGNAELCVSNSLFTAANVGTISGVQFIDSGNGYGNSSVHHCAFQSTIDTQVSGLPTSANITLTSSPYVNTDDFYTGKISFITGTGYFQDSPLLDRGSATSGLGEMTICRPLPIDNTNINSTSPSHIAIWSPRTTLVMDIQDADSDDIGYHYPRVDYVIDDTTVNLTRELFIEDGARIAFERGGAGIIQISSGGSIVRRQSSAGEAPVDMMEVISANAFDDAVDDVAWNDYIGIHVASDASRDCRFELMRFVSAMRGLWIDGAPLINPIENSQFIDCNQGILFNSPLGGDVQNNLFLRCGKTATSVDGGIALFCGGSYAFDYFIVGNTFAQCSRGLNFGSVNGTLSLVLEDNLFTQCELGVLSNFDVAVSPDDIHIVDRNNAWYANTENVLDTSYYGQLGTMISPANPHNLTDNPMLTHQVGAVRLDPSPPNPSLPLSMRPEDPFFAARWESFFPWDDGFFLAQGPDGTGTGFPGSQSDVSRWPFVVPDGVTVTSVDFSDIFAQNFIQLRIGVSDPSQITERGLFTTEIYGGMPPVHFPHPTNTGPGRLRISVGDYAFLSNWSTGSEPHIDITFSNGDEVSVSIPPNINATAIAERMDLWVASDGSTYWGQSSHTTDTVGFDQCSGYAIAVDPDGLAQGAYNALRLSGLTPAQAQSPLVDAGSRDLWNSGITCTGQPEGLYSNIDNPIDPSVTPGGLDPEDIMDIGYHYLGDLRRPQISCDVNRASYLYPDGATEALLMCGGLDSYTLMSRDYSDNTGLGSTVAYFGVEGHPFEDSVTAHVMAWDFENDPTADLDPIITLTERTWAGHEYSHEGMGPTVWGTIAGTCVAQAAGATSANHMGTQYLATVKRWTGNSEANPQYCELYIWRSIQDASGHAGPWQLIGARLHEHTGLNEDWHDHNFDINEVAIACNDDHLWIFWTQDKEDSGFYGTMIPYANDNTIWGGTFADDADGLTSGVFNFTTGQGNEVEFTNVSNPDLSSCSVLDAAFDFAYDGSDARDGAPRIVYRETDGIPRVARVQLNALGKPLPTLADIVTLQDLSVPGWTTAESDALAIDCNRWVPDGDTSETRVMVSYSHRDGTSGNHAIYEGLWCQTATCPTSTTTSWTTPEQVPEPFVRVVPSNNEYQRGSDLSQGFDHQPGHAFMTTDGPHVWCSKPNERLFNYSATDDTCQITTNAENRMDQWIVAERANDLMMIRVGP